MLLIWKQHTSYIEIILFLYKTESLLIPHKGAFHTPAKRDGSREKRNDSDM